LMFLPRGNLSQATLMPGAPRPQPRGQKGYVGGAQAGPRFAAYESRGAGGFNRHPGKGGVQREMLSKAAFPRGRCIRRGVRGLRRPGARWAGDRLARCGRRACPGQMGFMPPGGTALQRDHPDRGGQKKSKRGRAFSGRDRRDFRAEPGPNAPSKGALRQKKQSTGEGGGGPCGGKLYGADILGSPVQWWARGGRENGCPPASFSISAGFEAAGHGVGVFLPHPCPPHPQTKKKGGGDTPPRGISN